MFCKSSKAWPRALTCEYCFSLDEEAHEHLKFICAAYEWQVSRKWYSLHEYSASAVSWRPPLTKAVRVPEGGRGKSRRLARQSAHRVECIVGDQYVYGQEVPGRSRLINWSGLELR